MPANPSNQTLPLAWAATSALFIISFVFSILSLTSTHWATSEVLVSPGPNPPSAATAIYAGTNYRGPYHSAYFNFTQSTSIVGKFTNSTVIYSTICTDRDTDYDALCQQLQIGTKTLIAGSAFAGLAMLAAIVAFVISFAVAHQSALLSDLLRRTFILLGVFAALCEAFGGLIVANTLINLQSPDANFSSTSPQLFLQHHWRAGKGCAYVATAFIIATLGVLVTPKTTGNIRQRGDRGQTHGGEDFQDKET